MLGAYVHGPGQCSKPADKVKLLSSSPQKTKPAVVKFISLRTALQLLETGMVKAETGPQGPQFHLLNVLELHSPSLNLTSLTLKHIWRQHQVFSAQSVCTENQQHQPMGIY